MLANQKAINSVQYRNQIVKTDPAGTHPKILEFYKFFNAELQSRQYPFFAFEFMRSHERSDLLYRQGVSKARGGQSPHNYGLAVDIVHATRFWDLTRYEWDLIVSMGYEVARKRKIKITNGSTFRGLYDPAHWQLKNWKSHRAAILEIEEHMADYNRNRAFEEWRKWPSDNTQKWCLVEHWIALSDPKNAIYSRDQLCDWLR